MKLFNIIIPLTTTVDTSSAAVFNISLSRRGNRSNILPHFTPLLSIERTTEAELDISIYES
jgi:hypothetical protein